jgi:hypothetical protein
VKGFQLSVPRLGNYYGGLEVRLHKGKPEWCIENWDGFDWQPCPQPIFDAIIAEYGQQSEESK